MTESFPQFLHITNMQYGKCKKNNIRLGSDLEVKIGWTMGNKAYKPCEVVIRNGKVK